MYFSILFRAARTVLWSPKRKTLRRFAADGWARANEIVVVATLAVSQSCLLPLALLFHHQGSSDWYSIYLLIGAPLCFSPIAPIYLFVVLPAAVMLVLLLLRLRYVAFDPTVHGAAASRPRLQFRIRDLMALTVLAAFGTLLVRLSRDAALHEFWSTAAAVLLMLLCLIGVNSIAVTAIVAGSGAMWKSVLPIAGGAAAGGILGFGFRDPNFILAAFIYAVVIVAELWLLRAFGFRLTYSPTLL